MSACFITRVRLKNFTSIASCDVALRPLTFLVGPNGSGKSNFLDAHSAEGEHLFRSKPNTGSGQAEHHRSEATRLLF